MNQHFVSFHWNSSSHNHGWKMGVSPRFSSFSDDFPHIFHDYVGARRGNRNPQKSWCQTEDRLTLQPNLFFFSHPSCFFWLKRPSKQCFQQKVASLDIQSHLLRRYDWNPKTDLKCQASAGIYLDVKGTKTTQRGWFTWRIILVSKWFITMAVFLPNGRISLLTLIHFFF